MAYSSIKPKPKKCDKCPEGILKPLAYNKNGQKLCAEHNRGRLANKYAKEAKPMIESDNFFYEQAFESHRHKDGNVYCVECKLIELGGGKKAKPLEFDSGYVDHIILKSKVPELRYSIANTSIKCYSHHRTKHSEGYKKMLVYKQEQTIKLELLTTIGKEFLLDKI